jgi:two-component system OmpR family response regulator
MRILLVEDDGATADLIVRGLGELGHELVHLPSGSEAVRSVATDSGFDVAVVDRLLPDIDGVAVLRYWRANGVQLPALMLTALGTVGDRVSGLHGGADDYMVKPFALPELDARLCALQRRPTLGQPPTQLRTGDVHIDLLARRVRRADRDIHLQPREFDLLALMMRHPGRQITRKMFLESVWGITFDPHTNVVESHISRLRTKLNHGFARNPIETVQGVGYRIRADD